MLELVHDDCLAYGVYRAARNLSPAETKRTATPNARSTCAPLAKPCLGVTSAPSHEVFRVISRHLGRGGWIKAKRLQAFPACAVHPPLKLGHATRALTNLFDRNGCNTDLKVRKNNFEHGLKSAALGA